MHSALLSVLVACLDIIPISFIMDIYKCSYPVFGSRVSRLGWHRHPTR